MKSIGREEFQRMLSCLAALHPLEEGFGSYRYPAINRIEIIKDICVGGETFAPGNYAP